MERFDRNVVSESMEAVFALPWAALYSASPDPNITRRLESHGRQPEAIAAVDQFPQVARSPSRPPVYFLFGRADLGKENVRCPRNGRELLTRETVHAIGLLGRLAETITSAGVLVVDGLQAVGDWLRLETLLAFLPATGGVSVLWFGASSAHHSDPLFAELVAGGAIVADERPLPVALASLKASGALDALTVPARQDAGVVTIRHDVAFMVSPSLRLRVEASAAIVEDDWTAPVEPLDEEAEQEAFSRFHGDLVGARGLVEGVIRGFAIARTFEEQLTSKVDGALERRHLPDKVIVLHGQSGTGKSLALARLAVVARTRWAVPVLLATGRLPEVSDIDAFCIEAERAGASTTLVLCDANQNPDKHYYLDQALRSKGRRAVVVATSYRLDSEWARGAQFVAAEATVTKDERKALELLILKFGGGGNVALWPETGQPHEDDNLFALLYRVIAAGRRRLATGLSSEARATEQAIRVRARRPTAAPRRFASQLADALVRAGRHAGSLPTFTAEEDALFGDDAPGRLVDYVMAAGRIGQAVPLNLLMRALRSYDEQLEIQRIAALFDELDLFRWKFGDEQQSELLVGARLQLEAELICRRRLATPASELDALLDLISAVRSRGVDQDSEIRFLNDILQKLDHDGPRGDAYADGYLRIGRALTKLRLEHGLEDARIMLQESNFRRAWLRSRSADAVAPDLRDEVLDEARQVVETAIQRLGELRASRRIRENLFVERASIYGFLAVGHAKSDASMATVWSDYTAARAAGRRAIGIAPGYFPFDVALWTPADLLSEEGLGLEPSQRAELMADIYSVLDRIDPESLPPTQLEKFLTRSRRVARVLADKELLGEARRALAEANPAVALYLDARDMCPLLYMESAASSRPELRKQAARTADYLRSCSRIAMADTRCLRLLIEAEWTAATGDRLLRSERRPIPESSIVRTSLLGLVRELHALEGDSFDYSMRYLEAVLAWLCRDTLAAREGWRSLAADTEFEDRRRVHRRLFIADAQGKPVRFRGRLRQTQARWRLEVEGVSDMVDLVERDFRDVEMRSGFEVRDVAVAFNYLGPVADPLSRYEVP